MATQRNTLQACLVIVAATTTMALGFGGLALTSVFIRPLEAEFGWSRSEISLAYTLATVGMAAGGLVWGRLADRFDLRVLLFIGSTAMVAALGLLAATQALWQLHAAHFILGAFGFSCLYAPALAVTGQWFEQRRGLAMGIVTAGGAVGQGVMPWSADLLIDGFGWRTAFAVLAAATLAAFAATLPALRRPAAPAAGSGATASIGPAPAHFRFQVAALAAAAFLCCLCMGVPLVHLTSFVAAVCASPQAGATSLLVAMLCGAVGRIAFGMIADRAGSLPAYAIASAMQTVCVVLYPMLDGQASLLALSAVFGFGFAGNMTCLILCVREAAGVARFGQALGIVMLVAWAGMGVGGYVGGLVFDLTGGYALSFQVAFLAGILNLAVIGLLAVRRRRPRAEMLAGGAPAAA